LSAADIPRYAIPPHVAPIVALALILVFAFLFPVTFLPGWVSRGVGIPLFVVGLALWGWGVAGLVRRNESPNPGKATNHLITDGPYRFSRNPIYAGGILGLTGLAIALNTATGLAVAVVLALGVRQMVIAEERYLEAKFGDEWRDYRARVRRWV
jgi:protein-S-isoprenylcysteine O-methyltransferase Ste14